MNRLSRYCDGVMEAAWLVAIFSTALYFTLDTIRSFEPDKISLVRSAVLVALTCWGIKLISEGRPHWRKISRASWQKLARIPLVVPVSIMALVYLISSAFSISPLTSLQGSYDRAQGLYSLMTYIFLFAVIAANLRRSEQVNRLIAVLAAASFVVDVYAFLQHFGLDSANWVEFSGERIISTIGHPIFAGAFLSLVVVLLPGQIILAIQSFQKNRAAGLPWLLQAGLYSLIALMNLLAIWYTVSRGPLIGLFFGLVFMGMSMLAYWKLRRVFYGFLAVAVTIAALIALLNLPNGPLNSLRDSPYVGPFGHILDSEGGTGRTRVLMWNGVSRLVQPHEPVRFPDRSTDRWNILRPVVGYGPETLKLVFEDYYNIESFVLESRDLLTDHAHNEFWDLLAFYGVLGLLAEYALFLSLFFYALKWMGFIVTPADRNAYWGLALGGGMLGGIGIRLLLGTEFLGLGLPFGLLAGPMGILIYRIFRPTPAQNHPSPWKMLTLIGLFTLILTHYVEILFGIPVSPTRTLFWIASALLLVVGGLLPQEEEPETETEPDRLDELQQVALTAGLVTALTATLAPGFVNNNLRAQDAGSILINSLTMIARPAPHDSAGILFLFLGAIIIPVLVFQTQSDGQRRRGLAWPNLFFALGISLFASLLIWLLRSALLATLSRPAADIESFFANVSMPLTAHYLILFFILLVLGWAIAIPNQQRPIAKSPQAIAGYVILPILAVSGIVFFNIRPIQANTLAQQARTVAAGQQYQDALSIYDRVLELAPNEDTYYIQAAEAVVHLANSLPDPSKRETLYQIAHDDLKTAYDLNPLFINNIFSLARLYREWGEQTSNDSLRAARFLQSNIYFTAGLADRPYRVNLWLEWAELQAQMGNLASAREKINTVIATDPTYAPIYGLSGRLYAAEAQNQADPLKRDELLQKALVDFIKEVETYKNNGQNPALALFDLGDGYFSLQQYDQARAAYLQAADLNVGDFQWQLYEKIAETSGYLNDRASQREYLQKALDAAPVAEKPSIRQKLNQLAP